MTLREFKRIVKHVEDHIGHNQTTTGEEVNNAGKELIGKKFRGVYARDRLPKLKNDECMIANLDANYEKGSHWIAIYCSGNSYIVYDSFGRKIDSILPKITFSGSGKKIITSDDYDPEQQIHETNCAQNSLGWLLYLYKNGIHKALKI